MSGLAIWTWKAWDRYLIQALLKDADHIELGVHDGPSEWERALVSSPTTVLLHINLSYCGLVPLRRAEMLDFLERRGVLVWNARVRDVTKPAIQRHNSRVGLPDTAASADGPGSELLMVKTSYNARGVPEGRLSPSERRALRYPEIRPARIHPDTEYPILCRSEIPVALWNDPYHFIERLITNDGNDFYRLYLTGERVVLSHGRTPRQVKRMEGHLERVNYFVVRAMATDSLGLSLLPTPASEAFRAGVHFADTFALDYGVVDVVTDNAGNSHIIDVGGTPYWGGDRQPGMLEHLRKGLP